MGERPGTRLNALFSTFYSLYGRHLANSYTKYKVFKGNMVFNLILGLSVLCLFLSLKSFEYLLSQIITSRSRIIYLHLILIVRMAGGAGAILLLEEVPRYM